MNRKTGLILRMAGLLVEAAFLVLLVALGDDPRTLAGVSIRQLSVAGLAFGFCLLAVGWVIILISPKRPPR